MKLVIMHNGYMLSTSYEFQGNLLRGYIILRGSIGYPLEGSRKPPDLQIWGYIVLYEILVGLS